MSTNHEKSDSTSGPKLYVQLPPRRISSTTPEAKAKIRAKQEADARPEAIEEAHRLHNKERNQRIFFWAVVIVVTGGLLLTASLGTLVHPDFWPSLIWLIPLVVLVAPVVYWWVREENDGQFGTHFLMALVAMVVVYIFLLLTMASGISEGWWHNVAGNETAGSRGLIGDIGLIGLLIVLALTLVLPLVFISLLMKALIQKHVNVVWVIILAVLVPLSLIFAIGLSITNNAGM